MARFARSANRFSSQKRITPALAARFAGAMAPSPKAMATSSMQDATLVTAAGRAPADHHGMVNPPICRASTILFPTVDAFERARTHEGVTYGRAGTPTTYAFEEALAALEGGYRSIALASGKAACNLTLAALTEAGDHILVADSVYAPTRHFCDRTLRRFGVTTSYYDPRIGAGIEALIRPNTRLIYMESPGSLTFEVQDVPAIVEPSVRSTTRGRTAPGGQSEFSCKMRVGGERTRHRPSRASVPIHPEAALDA
jgi:hypothetical protein